MKSSRIKLIRRIVLSFTMTLLLFSGSLLAQTEFITSWQTNIADEIITIPTATGEIYNYSIDWGDGSPVETITSDISPTHQYGVAASYTISIDGDFPRILFDGTATNRLNILSIEQWGNIVWSSMEGAFDGCENLNVTASDAPDLTATISTARMFRNAISMNADLNNWDVINITNMESMFTNAVSFNGDITGWDVTNVTNMSFMFQDATVFNQDISTWNVSNVIEFGFMFANATNFNQAINNWSTGAAQNMNTMFSNTAFFNADISGWDVSNVRDLQAMFSGAAAFNQDIGSWNVGNVENMNGMFINSGAFNQDIGNWNVARLTTMSQMFASSPFNQNLGSWNVSSVTDMEQAFGNSGMSTDNYDATLNGWANLPSLRNDVILGAEGINYCASQAARNNLISTYNWTVNDEGFNCTSVSESPANFGILFDEFSDNIVTFANGPGFTEDITIEAWINFSTFSSTDKTIASWEFPDGSYVLFGLSDNRLSMKLNFFDGTNFVTNEVTDPDPCTSPDASGFLHLAVSGNVNSGYRLYVDGELRIDDIITNPGVGTGGIFSIGARNNTDPGLSLTIVDQFPGIIDEVRIYDIQRTDIEINNDIYRTFSVDDNQFIAGYNFNEGFGNILGDINLTSQNGTLVGFLGEPWVSSTATEFPVENDIMTLNNANNSASSGGLTITGGNGFLTDPNDFINFGHNGGSPDQFVTDLFIDSELIRSRSEREYFVQTFNEGTGGEVDFTFTSRESDTNLTYYLLDRDMSGTAVYEPTSYSSVNIIGNTYTFTVPVDSLRNRFYSLGRGLGAPGNALNFDPSGGIRDHVVVDNPPAITTDMTIEAWINLPQSNFGTIVGFGGYAVEGRYFRIGTDGLNQLFAEIAIDDLTAEIRQVSTTTITPGVWTHVAFTKIGNDINFYIDGELAGTATLTIDAAATTMVIGATDDSTPSPIIEGFLGDIDELRIWDVARTQQEIQENQFQTIAGNEANLQAYYRFDQPAGVGSFLPDYSGNNHVGVLTNFEFIGETSDWVVSRALSTTQNALSFDGFDDDARSASPVSLTDDHTIELWVQNNETNPALLQNLFRFGDDNSTLSIQGYLEGGLFHLELFENEGTINNRTIQALDVDFSDLEWHHVVYSYDADISDVKIYLDGVEQTTSVLVDEGNFGTIDLSGTMNLGSGGFSPPILLNPFNGVIDEVRVWNSLLTVETIREYINTENLDEPLHPNLSSLQVQYSFNEGLPGGDNTGITQATDSSPNANNVNLFSFSLNDLSSNFIESQAFEQGGQIAILGNEINIPESNTGNLLTDNTNMGLVRLGEGSLTSEFQIVNVGNGILSNLLSNPIITGLDTFGQFTTELSVETLNPFDTALLTVTYVPEEVGISRIFIQVEDDNLNTFLFSVSGTAYEDLPGPGTAMSFDGANNNFNLGQTYNFDSDSAFSIEAWVNYEDPGSTGFMLPILSKRVNNTAGTGYDLTITDGVLSFGMSDDGFTGIIATSNDFINPGEWTHVAVTYDGSLLADGVSLYINGVLAPSSNLGSLGTASTIINDQDIYMGFDVRNLQYYLGRIDEVRIWGNALTSEEIRSNLHNTVDPSSAGLIGYYRGDLTNGLQLANLSSEFGTAEFAIAPSVIFDISNAPLNNETNFINLQERRAIWSGVEETTSANIVLFGNDFILDEGDRIFIADDNPTVDDGVFVNSRLNALSPQVTNKLERNWFINVVDSADVQGGGELLLSFTGQIPDSSRTYYLLKSNDNSSDFEVASYGGYTLGNDSITFGLDASDLETNAFYSLGRSEGLPGNALLFDGDNDQVEIEGAGHVENFTYEVWLRPDQLNVNQRVFSLQNEGGGGIILDLNSNNLFDFEITNTAGLAVTISSVNAINQGEWVHLAVSGDGNEINLYINGQLVMNDVFVNGSDFSGLLTLGADALAIAGGLQGYEGAMDEFKIWGSPRSELEIQMDMTTVPSQNRTVDIGGILTYFKFDQIGGSEILPDHAGTGFFISGRLNNFDFNAQSGWIPSNAFEIPIEQNALSFDGIDDFVNIPTLPFPDNYTVEAWINTSDLGADEFDLKTIFSWDFPEAGGSTDGLVRLILVQGEIRYVQQIVNSTFSSSNSTGVFIGANEWHHVAVSNEQNPGDDNTVSIYVDGQLVSTLPSELRVVGPQNFNLGAITFSSVTSDFFPGQMDEVRIWDRVLSLEEIRSNINREIPDPNGLAELISYYQFNQGTPAGNNGVAIELRDIQANHNGLLDGFSLSGIESNYLTSTLFDELTPELSVFADGDNTPSIDGTIFGFGTRIIGQTLSSELVIANTGFDTLNILSINLPAEFTETRGLVDAEILPFETDTITFDFTVTAEGLASSDVVIQDDFNPTPFTVSYEVEGYPVLPGAGGSYSLFQEGQFGSTNETPTELASQSFSVEYWAQRDDNTTPDYVFGQGPGLSNINEELHVGFRTGDVVTFSFFANDLNFNWAEANDDWNHFAFTFDYDEVAGTGTRRIFINGLEVAADPTPVEPFIGIGGFFVGQAPFGQTFIGNIDELRVWNVTLDEATIRRNLARKLDNESLPLDSLIAYYRFDDGFTPFIDDLTGRYDFVTQGGVSSVSSAPFGDRSLFTYSENSIVSTNPDQPIAINNIFDPSQGIHLYQIEDTGSPNATTEVFNEIITEGIFGVFAPNNTFDFSAGLGNFPENENFRLVTRLNQSEGNNWRGASNLFETDLIADSVRTFNQMSAEFTLGVLDYPLVNDAGSALSFTSADEIDLLEAPITTYGSFTIEYWIQPGTDLNPLNNFFQVDPNDTGTNSQILTLATRDGHVELFLRESNNGLEAFVQGNITINDGEWHHVAYVREGASISIYIDGVLDVSENIPFATDAVFPENANAVIRGDGNLDEFRFWDAALTSETIRSHIFTNDLTNHPDRPALKSYYRFDDGTGSSRLVDLMNYNNGTLVNLDPLTAWIPSGAFATPANTVVSLADSGPGSLRSVVELANSTPEIDTIRFDLPGNGPWIISTASVITITDSLVIDATSQPGWDIVSGSVIEIEGNNTTSVGLEVMSGYFELYGLRINDYLDVGLLLRNNTLPGFQIGEQGRGNIFINNGGSGIQIDGASEGLLQSNFVGSDFDGSEGLNDVGIFLTSEARNNVIGGMADVANVIAFNNVGVQINGIDALGNQIRQNEISCNVNRGITINDDANGGITAPIITSISATRIDGTGNDGQEIDVYLSTDPCSSDQGIQYLGTGVVTAGTWSVTGLSLTPGAFFTATANTLTDGTSEFSEAVEFFSEIDRMALERIFNDLNGANWDPAVNWLDPTLNISQWDGITTLDGRVVAIDLSGRNLTGSFPAFTGDELSAIETLLINSNNISEIPDLSSLLQLTTLEVQDNFLDFSSLEPNIGITDFIFIPQNLLLEEVSPIESEGADATLDRTIGGNANVYSWTKDGVLIDGETLGTLSLTDISFEDEGNYVATVTNANVPGLTITTNPIIFRVSSLERDELALRAIYAALDGPNWDESRNGWLQGTVSEAWQGVTIVGNRVTGVDISSSNAIGILPVDVLEILSLATLNISNNQIDSIPSLGNLTQLTSVNLDGNQIEFDDLEANQGLTGLVIGTQTLGDNPQTLETRGGESLELSVNVGGANNTYQWMLGDNEIDGATQPIYLVDNVNRSSQGEYQCVITNSVVLDVEIRSAINTIQGIANLGGLATIAGTEDVFTDGTVSLLAVRQNAYDTIRAGVPLSADGSYNFEDVPLDDYIALIDPTDLTTFLPTYHVQSIQWDFAETVGLDIDTMGIDILVERVPEDVEVGVGALTGEIFTDFPDEGRLAARRRVRRVGCALRRRRGQGRPGDSGGRVEMDADGFELFSYQTTNDEGQFVFNDLPEGTYRLFIEYPGIPLREDSFTEFEVGDNPNEDDFEVLVTVFEDGILIEQQNVVSVPDGITGLIDIYPNPATDELFLKMNAEQAITIEIIDLKGVKVFSESLDNSIDNEVKRLNISGIQSGIYILRVILLGQNNDVLKTGKLIIQN